MRAPSPEELSAALPPLWRGRLHQLLSVARAVAYFDPPVTPPRLQPGYRVYVLAGDGAVLGLGTVADDGATRDFEQVPLRWPGDQA